MEASNATRCTVAYNLPDGATQRYPGRCWNMPSIDRCLQSKVVMAAAISHGAPVDPGAYWQHLYVCENATTLVPTCCPVLTEETMEGLVLDLRFHVMSLLADATVERAVLHLPPTVELTSARLNRTHTIMDVACGAADADACASYAMASIQEYAYGFQLHSFLLARADADLDENLQEVRLYDASYLCVALALVILIAACVYYGRRRHRQWIMERAYRLLD